MPTEFNDLDRGTPLDSAKYLLNITLSGEIADKLREDFPCTLARMTHVGDGLALAYARNHDHEAVIGDDGDGELIAACVELCVASGTPVPVSGPFTGALLAMLLKILAEQLKKWLEDRLS